MPSWASSHKIQISEKNNRGCSASGGAAFLVQKTDILSEALFIGYSSVVHQLVIS